MYKIGLIFRQFFNKTIFIFLKYLAETWINIKQLFSFFLADSYEAYHTPLVHSGRKGSGFMTGGLTTQFSINYARVSFLICLVLT